MIPSKEEICELIERLNTEIRNAEALFIRTFVVGAERGPYPSASRDCKCAKSTR